METWTMLVRPLRGFALTAGAAFLLTACAGTDQPGPGSPASSPAAAQPQVQGQAPLPVLKPTEPPPDLDPIQRFAWQQVVQLGDAFAAGDAEAFLARVSRGFYRGYATLERSLQNLLADSSSRSAVVAVRKVAEDMGRVSVRAEWTRSVTRRDGSVEARHGETEFLFLRSDTSLRLLDYRGDAPFAIGGI
jgi:hypothetical protein